MMMFPPLTRIVSTCRLTTRLRIRWDVTEPAVRMAEPVWQDAVLRDPIEDTVRPDDRRVHGAGQHQRADDGDKRAEGDTQRHRTLEMHRETADRVVEEGTADGIRDDHHDEERGAGGENEAVDED